MILTKDCNQAACRVGRFTWGRRVRRSSGLERLNAAQILSALPLCLSLLITGSFYFSKKKISVQNKEKVTPSSNDRLQVDICLLYGITQAKHVVVPLLQDTHVSADRFSHHLYAFSTGQKSHSNIFRSGSCEQWERVPSAFTPGEHAQFCHAKWWHLINIQRLCINKEEIWNVDY